MDIIYQNMYSKLAKIAYYRRHRPAKKIGKNCFFYTSNANKITLSQHFFIFFLYLDSLNVLVDDY
jgi:hypothetical protein